MTVNSFRSTSLLVAFLSLTASTLSFAEEAAPKSLIDLSAAGVESKFKPSNDVTLAAKDGGLLATVVAGGKEGYPGLDLKPEDGPWNLSAFGHVEAKITNTGAKAITVALRVDGTGDPSASPWNTEQTSIKPGATSTITVIFGYAYGHKPAYPLKGDAIANVKIFTLKGKEEQSFRIDSIVAGGPAGEQPKVDPASIRIKPKDGQMLAADVILAATEKAQTAFDAGTAKVTFLPGKAALFKVKPPQGRWDLRDALEVTVKLKNTGDAATSPRVSLDSNGGPTDAVAVDLAAGEEKEITIPFTAKTPWEGAESASNQGGQEGAGKAGTGTKFTSNTVSSITVWVDKSDKPQSIAITSAVLSAPVAELPDWLGQRPPVEGEWTKTFDDDFTATGDGTALDPKKWNYTGPNYWDKASHWSKDNLILADGVLKMRYEKKRGPQNDDAEKGKVTDWQSGYFDTYGKFVQKYGYFEARMKLPTAPGLWPAFWMMPDRGVEAGEQWKRSATENGGMEFDIMEFLSGWGPHRYNIAMHWDGYGKNHKATGSEKIYVPVDKDGYITAGLLWTPGEVVYYCQGKEVLRWQNPRIASVPEYMMFTLPQGGWDNTPIDVKQLPADFTIDYVRVWQRNDLVGK